jgi:uncharacterized alpha-E superfamily protein
MLARIAEELFWLGRYLSRAEHTARMLDSLFAVNLQAPAGTEAAPLSWPALMAIMGDRLPDDAPHTGEAVLVRLTIDPQTPASVRTCVVNARERARTVRDVISREMWEAVNTLYLQILEPQLEVIARTGPYAVYQLTKDRCAVFWGLADQTMLRDEAYAFLAAGGRLESAQMVLRMLRVALPDIGEQRATELTATQRDARARAMLYAVGGIQAYQRGSRLQAGASQVTRFLLFDGRYPESVAAAIARARSSLAGIDRDPRESTPLLRLDRLGAELEFRRSDADDAELPAMFVSVQRELDRIDGEIVSRYFAAAPLESHAVFA